MIDVFYIEGEFDLMIINEDWKKEVNVNGKKEKKSKEMDLVSKWPLYLLFLMLCFIDSREVD